MEKEVIENIVGKQILSITRTDDDEFIIELSHDCFIKIKADPYFYEPCYLNVTFCDQKKNLEIYL